MALLLFLSLFLSLSLSLLHSPYHSPTTTNASLRFADIPSSMSFSFPWITQAPQCPKCGDYFVEKYTPPPDPPAFRDSRQYHTSGGAGGGASGGAGGGAGSLPDLRLAQLAR